MNAAISIIEQLRKSGIQLLLRGENLEVVAQEKNIEPNLLAEIRKHKQDILDYLKKRAGNRLATIPAAIASSRYLLSSSQRRLWMLDQIQNGGNAYHLPKVHMFNERLDIEALTLALRQLISRHESLRTIFKEIDGEVYQVIQEPWNINVDSMDLRGGKGDLSLLKRFIKEDFSESFDLGTGPLFRAKLYQLSEDQWVFTYVMHHIISDGWSVEVLLKELHLLYASRKRKEHCLLPPLDIQYKDYAVWQQNELKSPEFEKHKTYWLEKFKGELPVLELPTDFPRPAYKTFKGGAAVEILSADINFELTNLCQKSGATLYMALLAGVYLLFHRYSDQRDIIVGTPIAGRERAGLQHLVGFFVNTLALRCEIQQEDTYYSLLERVKVLAREAYQHQAFPFDEVVASLPLQRDRSRNPLFDVMVTLKNADTSDAGSDMWQMEDISLSGYSDICIFDLTFTFVQAAQGISLELGYNSDIFSSQTAKRIAGHYHQVMLAAVQDPGRQIHTLNILSNAERKQLLYEFNSAIDSGTQNKTILDAFSEQVIRTPNDLALISGDNKVTYEELDERSNHIANYLADKYSIQPDDLIGIQLQRNEWLIISILAVLKSGGAYVPIDPDYPAERTAYLVKDANCKVLLDEAELNTAKEWLSSQSSVKTNPVKAHQLAYVIYTSGSTGTPKGVMVEHGNLFSFVKTCKEKYTCLKPVMPLIASCSFDISLFQFLFPLLSGGTVLILSKTTIADVKQLISQLKQVTILDTVPALMSQIIQEIELSGSGEAFYGISDLFIGGDAIPDELLTRMRKTFPRAKINVTYGPTESSVFVTGREYLPYDEGPFRGAWIGKPNANANVFILDAHRQLVPVGVTGQIYIGGPCVTRGYLNQRELTDEKFLEFQGLPIRRLYQTGDNARLLPDGTIEYKGRVDNQVKIRGFRIELGEVENAAKRYANLEASVALVTTDNTFEKQIALYVVSRVILNESDFRSHLSKILPAFMMPSKIVQLDSIPLTPNGKIDRNSLLKIKGIITTSNVEYLAPRNELEAKLVRVWQELLDRDQIGIDDNFFEVGGNSIKIIKLARMTSEVLNKEIPIAQLFEFSTIRQIINSAGEKLAEWQKQEEFDRDKLINDLDKIIS